MTRLTVAIAAAMLGATPVHAAECPVERDGEKISEAIEKAPSCEASYKVFQACAYIASIDTMFGGLVTEKCEKTFLAKLSLTQSKAYERGKNACAKKYAKEEGTMYRSFEATCVSKLAVSYAKRYGSK